MDWNFEPNCNSLPTAIWVTIRFQRLLTHSYDQFIEDLFIFLCFIFQFFISFLFYISMNTYRNSHKCIYVCACVYIYAYLCYILREIKICVFIQIYVRVCAFYIYIYKDGQKSSYNYVISTVYDVSDQWVPITATPIEEWRGSQRELWKITHVTFSGSTCVILGNFSVDPNVYMYACIQCIQHFFHVQSEEVMLNCFGVVDSYRCSQQDGNTFIILMWPNFVFFLKIIFALWNYSHWARYCNIMA